MAVEVVAAWADLSREARSHAACKIGILNTTRTAWRLLEGNIFINQQGKRRGYSSCLFFDVRAHHLV